MALKAAIILDIGSTTRDGSSRAALVQLHCRPGALVRLSRNELGKAQDDSLTLRLRIPRKKGIGPWWQTVGRVETSAVPELVSLLHGVRFLDGVVDGITRGPNSTTVSLQTTFQAPTVSARSRR